MPAGGAAPAPPGCAVVAFSSPVPATPRVGNVPRTSLALAPSPTRPLPAEVLRLEEEKQQLKTTLQKTKEALPRLSAVVKKEETAVRSLDKDILAIKEGFAEKLTGAFAGREGGGISGLPPPPAPRSPCPPLFPHPTLRVQQQNHGPGRHARGVGETEL